MSAHGPMHGRGEGRGSVRVEESQALIDVCRWGWSGNSSPQRRSLARCLAQGDRGREATRWAGRVSSKPSSRPSELLSVAFSTRERTEVPILQFLSANSLCRVPFAPHNCSPRYNAENASKLLILGILFRADRPVMGA